MAHDPCRMETFQFDRNFLSNKSVRKSYKSFKKDHGKLTKMNIAQERTAKTFSKVGTPDYISP